MKSGNLNFLEPSGPLQACNGTDLPFLLQYVMSYCTAWGTFLQSVKKLPSPALQMHCRDHVRPLMGLTFSHFSSVYSIWVVQIVSLYAVLHFSSSAYSYTNAAAAVATTTTTTTTTWCLRSHSCHPKVKMSIFMGCRMLMVIAPAVFCSAVSEKRAASGSREE